MSVIHQPITGSELTGDETSPLSALWHFYSAFNGQDYTLMESNWLQNEDASMSNPLGGVKRGWKEIKEVYKKIFSGPASVYVEFYDYSIHVTDNMFLAAGKERGWLDIDNERIDLAIRTSRIYTCYDGAWKQVHHHGSMDNPELLKKYQTTLLKKTA